MVICLVTITLNMKARVIKVMLSIEEYPNKIRSYLSNMIDDRKTQRE